jgi:hypothetical protein
MKSDLFSGLKDKKRKDIRKKKMETEPKCATCPARLKAEANPKGFWSRLWKWHTSWCPGWKAYQKSLAEAPVVKEVR